MSGKISLPKIFVFEWDQGNLEHIRNHKVEYNECEDVFYDEPVYFEDTRHSILEERFIAYGFTSEQRLLTIIFTVRGSKIRVISPRDQNKKERDVYKKYKGGENSKA